MPAMPAPPMPTKWIVRVRPIRSFIRALPASARQAAASFSAASGFACARAASAIASRLRRVAEQCRKLPRERSGVSSRFRDGETRTARDEVSRVARLVVVGREPRTARARADANGLELCDRQRTRARHDEIGPAIGVGDVVDEAVDACFDPVLRIRPRALVRRRRPA